MVYRISPWILSRSRAVGFGAGVGGAAVGWKAGVGFEDIVLLVRCMWGTRRLNIFEYLSTFIPCEDSPFDIPFYKNRFIN